MVGAGVNVAVAVAEGVGGIDVAVGWGVTVTCGVGAAQAASKRAMKRIICNFMFRQLPSRALLFNHVEIYPS